MAEPSTVYKITILYMLNKAEYPLSNSQIYQFFLDMDYTDYFNVQDIISNLVDTSLITPETTHGTTYYTLSPAGKESLDFFKAKLNEGIEQDVQRYFQTNGWEFRQDNSVLADYHYTRNCNYEVTCQLRNGKDNVVSLTLSVSSKEQAEAICWNWKQSSGEVYAYLMDTLVR